MLQSSKNEHAKQMETGGGGADMAFVHRGRQINRKWRFIVAALKM